ncbi:MAG: 23S rRNA (adenine(2503)-C(2))-methyltransferase RlmN [Oligoflexia bacterium]|nr:23S rRNA (adenine(2503)-C(2))-methyltransferase RlmN [Oligoflexia bacterium]
MFENTSPNIHDFATTTNFYNLTYSEVTAYLLQNGHSKFVTTQLFNWIYKKNERNHTLWSNISKNLKSQLTNHFSFAIPEIITTQISKDGTVKFLFKMCDQEVVEGVLIKFPDRLTLCVSTQVGCAMGCNFCYTGTQGFKRNLSTAEIVGQYLSADLWLKNFNQNNQNNQNNQSNLEKITNVVYMGQGEPLNNFLNVKKATLNLMEPEGLAIGQRKITLSTSGMVPQIMKLDEFPSINIAISLHSARNSVRDVLMPINKIYDLERLFEAIKTIPLKAHRRITYEYLLIDGLNNTLLDIEALCKLIPRETSKINIIPFNEYPNSKFKCPSESNIRWFSDELGKRNFTSTIRLSKGADILAACGQLRSQMQSGTSD